MPLGEPSSYCVGVVCAPQWAEELSCLGLYALARSPSQIGVGAETSYDEEK